LDLPPSGWTANSTGTVYKFKNALAPAGPSPVKAATVKVGKGIKVAAKGLGGLVLDGSQPSVTVVVTVGSDRYCSRFSAPLKNQVGTFLSKTSTPAPCPSSSSTTSLPGSSTTSLPGNATSTTIGSTTSTTISLSCGNGVVDPGEQCDGTVCPGFRACRFDCTCPPSACGNGVLDPALGEECDPAGPGCPDGAPCSSLCLCPVCGNGVREQGEECDFAGAPCTDGNGCTINCTCKSIVVLEDSVPDLAAAAADMSATYGFTNVELRTPLMQLSAHVPTESRAAMASDPRISVVQAMKTFVDAFQS